MLLWLSVHSCKQLWVFEKPRNPKITGNLHYKVSKFQETSFRVFSIRFRNVDWKSCLAAFIYWDAKICSFSRAIRCTGLQKVGEVTLVKSKTRTVIHWKRRAKGLRKDMKSKRYGDRLTPRKVKIASRKLWQCRWLDWLEVLQNRDCW